MNFDKTLKQCNLYEECCSQITFDRVILLQCLKCEWQQAGMKEKLARKIQRIVPMLSFNKILLLL